MWLWKMLVGDIAPPGLAGLQLGDTLRYGEHMRLLSNTFFNVEKVLQSGNNHRACGSICGAALQCAQTHSGSQIVVSMRRACVPIAALFVLRRDRRF